MLEDILVALQKGLLRHHSRRKQRPRRWDEYAFKRPASPLLHQPKPTPTVPKAWALYLNWRNQL